MILLLLASTADAPAFPIAPSTVAAATAARQALRNCAPSEAAFAASPDADWTPVNSVGEAHAALRRTLAEPMPSARTMVSIHGIGGDLETTEYSVVITRALDGTWTGTAVGQSTIWIMGAKPNPMPRQAWTLPPDRGRRLDTLLADPCFYAEPTRFKSGHAPPVVVLVMETRTPQHQRRVAYAGNDVAGLTREVTDLTFPPAR